jgi:mono/diheme cytochrome c family protein
VRKRSTGRSLPRLPAGLRAAAIAGTLLAGLAAPAQAQDAARGKELYETHCLGCHYERIHKRDPARSLVRSLPQLRAEVARRMEQTGRRFTVDDGDDIAEYLNQSHYHLKK